METLFYSKDVVVLKADDLQHHISLTKLTQGV